jgi:hypothetical protein
MPKTFLTAIYYRLVSYLFYKLILHCSKHVSWKDFNVIWNMAYEAHTEEEWKRLKGNYPQRNLSSSINKQPEGWVDSPAAIRSGGPPQRIYSKLESIDGREERQPRDWRREEK